MSTEVRALTVRPPWSWAIERGAKTVENRTGGPTRWRYRGPLLIHAGAGWSKRGQHDPRITALWRATYPQDMAPRLGVRNHRPIMRPGELVARCELVDAHEASPMCGCGEWGEHEYVDAAGTRRTSITHLILDRIEPLPPNEPQRGYLGLWRPAQAP